MYDSIGRFTHKGKKTLSRSASTFTVLSLHHTSPPDPPFELFSVHHPGATSSHGGLCPLLRGTQASNPVTAAAPNGSVSYRTKEPCWVHRGRIAILNPLAFENFVSHQSHVLDTLLERERPKTSYTQDSTGHRCLMDL